MSQLLLDIAPENRPTLDNFVAGRNLELLSALRHALAGSSSERSFFVWGEAGSGKSHLLQACVNAALTIAAVRSSLSPTRNQEVYVKLLMQNRKRIF